MRQVYTEQDTIKKNKIIHGLSFLAGDLNDGGASSDGVVVDGVLAAGEDGVGLAGEALGDLDHEATLDGLGLDEGGAGDGNEGGVDGGIAVGALEDVVGGGEHDLVTGHDRALSLGDEGRESLDGESGVALGARLDEARGQGEDLVEGERGVEGLGEGLLVEAGADVGRVAGLDREDGASSGEVGLAHDVGSSAEVSGNTDTLEDGGGHDKAVDIVVAEVVGASLDGVGTSSCK